MNADTRSNISNYLEGRNASDHPNVAGNGNYQSGAASSNFNDILFCIDATLSVTVSITRIAGHQQPQIKAASACSNSPSCC